MKRTFSEFQNFEGSTNIPRIPEDNRLTIEPITRRDIFQFYTKQIQNFWTADSLDFSKDLDDWRFKMSSDQKFFISHILAFFAASDTLVNKNITDRFLNDVGDIPEVGFVYRFQSAMEDIHSLTYSRMITTYIQNKQEQDNILNAVKHFPCIREKAEWVVKWIESNDTFAHRLIAFAFVEGVFFSGSFCSIFWLSDQGLMKSLVSSNGYISRDEALHCEFACCLYNMLTVKLPQNEVYEILEDAVSIEEKFITESLPCRLMGMNSDLMIEYIRFTADNLLVMLGYNKRYNNKNPFPFMEHIGLSNKSNFFERDNINYSLSSNTGGARVRGYDTKVSF